ncbi:MAG: PE-PPE domain-containing protein [Mycobacteriaceae bacterium]
MTARCPASAYPSPGVPVYVDAGHSEGFVVRFGQRVCFAVMVWIAAIVVVVAQLSSTATDARSTVRIGYPDGVSLLASQTALIMNGTFEPVITPEWISQVMQELVTPTRGGGYLGTAMTTPEEFWPVSGLFSLSFNDSVKTGYELLDAQVRRNLQADPGTPLAVFGYSQSAMIATVQKRSLAAQYADGQDVPPVSFVVAGNPFRPNGGFLARFPMLAQLLAPSTQANATPTDTGLATYDIARQYEMWADFPTYPLNLLADINALFGLMDHWYLPESITPLLSNVLSTVSLDPASPNYNPDTVVQHYGDTTYYTIPAQHLPMLYPLRWIGLGPLTDIVEPTLRVLIELGYDRTASPGQVVRAGLIPNIDPAQLAADLGAAFAEGAAAFQDLFTPRAAQPAGAISDVLPSPATEPNPIASPRVNGHRGRTGLAAAAVPFDGSPQPDFAPNASREPNRVAVRHPSSKIATARVHPADAA